MVGDIYGRASMDERRIDQLKEYWSNGTQDPCYIAVSQPLDIIEHLLQQVRDLELLLHNNQQRREEVESHHGVLLRERNELRSQLAELRAKHLALEGAARKAVTSRGDPYHSRAMELLASVVGLPFTEP